MTTRLMILGAKGQIGQALSEASAPEGWEIARFGRDELDITNAVSVRNLIQKEPPDLIVNAAGLTNVDQAEKNEDLAMAVNFSAVANIAAQCSSLDIPLIHLSTDYVFDGKDEEPYEPDAQMNPVNTYGYSKMMGEEAIRHELAWHVILRISSVFSAYGENLLTKTLSLLQTRDELRMVNDQRTCPTPAGAIAQAIYKIATQIQNGKTDGFGTFHLCGEGETTRYAFTQKVMSLIAPYTDKRPTIEPVASEVFVDFAPRPAYSVLSCDKLQQVYGISQPDWEEALSKSCQTLLSASPNKPV